MTFLRFPSCRFLLTAMLSVTSLTAPAVAEEVAEQAGWKIYRSEHSCSIGKSDNGRFVFLTLWANGREGFRFHDKRWRIETTAPLALRLSGPNETFELIGNPAKTSSGDAGFWGLSEKSFLSALVHKGPVGIEANGFDLGTAALDGLNEAYPLVEQCRAGLEPDERKPIPKGMPARMIEVPRITANEMPTTQWSGPIQYEVVIDPNGTAKTCSIIEPDVEPFTGDAICKLIQDRARFSAAKRITGEAIEARLRGTITP